MVTITYFVHGTTPDNERIATGWLPGELSELGVQQAHTLGEQLANRHFDAVICSDLKRAADTSRIAFGNGKFTTDERLREANYGDYNGKTHNLFKDRMEDFIDTPFPNGESYRDVEQRMRSLCDDLKKKYDGKHIALLAHQAPQLALEVIAGGKTWPEAIASDWRRTGAYQPGWEYTLV